MRTPWQAWRDFTREFRTVMASEEARILRELVPSDDEVARATARRRDRGAPTHSTDNEG